MNLFYPSGPSNCRSLSLASGCGRAYSLVGLPIQLFVASLLFLLFANFQNTQAQAPAKQWDKTFGGDGDDYLRSSIPTTGSGYNRLLAKVN